MTADTGISTFSMRCWKIAARHKLSPERVFDTIARQFVTTIEAPARQSTELFPANCHQYEKLTPA